MRFSEQWLREWADPAIDTQALAEQLTMAGLEVDCLQPAAPEFSGVVVARVESVKPHPNADKLSLCAVEAGQGTVEVVCGAGNVRADMWAALAPVGSVLPDAREIKAAKIRGVTSQGMLCSASELGLAERGDGLLELPEDLELKPGQDLRQTLQLNDTVIELELTPNRGDCLSIAGIAREVAALNTCQLSPQPCPEQPIEASQAVQVKVDSFKDCSRYCGRVINGVDAAAPTPYWMKERLRRSGLRSISALVDITNYVMLELGQPLHAFDLEKLQGGITVRRARKGEQLTLLQQEAIKLDDNRLVIADATGPVALAGVMGGASTAVGEKTRNAFLESACFSPLAVAGTGRAYKLHTDSLHRFERGVDPDLQRRALERASELILSVCGGQAGPISEAADGQAAVKAETRLRHARLRRLLGVDLKDADIIALLERLDMTVGTDPEGCRATPPSYRYDINGEADLIEEVARLHGYQNLPESRRPAQVAFHPQPEGWLPEHRVLETLIQRGYQEVVTYSFVDRELQQKLMPETEGIALDNPIASQYAQMRTTLWSSLLPALAYNQARQQSRVRLFEVGERFLRKGAANPRKITEETVIAGVMSGTAWPEQWGLPERPCDFYDLKGDVEALLKLGGPLSRMTIEPRPHPALHPGQSAAITTDGGVFGWLGRLHPRIEKYINISSICYIFEVNYGLIAGADVPSYKAISEYPSIRRDLALVIDDKLRISKVFFEIEKLQEPLLQDLKLFDLYQGKGLPDGCKSIALSLIFQENTRTLTDEEIDDAMARIEKHLGESLGAKKRG